MAYQPSTLSSGVTSGSSVDPNAVSLSELTFRMKAVANRYPYMAQRPDVLATMAQSLMETEPLVQSAGQMYAMHVGDAFSKQLTGLSGASQRAIVSRLSPNQQSALASLGYQPPARDEGGLIGDIGRGGATVLGVFSKGAGAIPGVRPAVGGALKALTWAGNFGGHLYRTMQIDQGDNDWATIGGVALGIAAGALAPVTGGGSLAAFGMLAGGGILGGTAASFIQNPNDWSRAWSNSWDGEKTFRAGAVKRAAEILQDPRLSGVAQDLTSAGVNVVDFAHEMAGHRETDTNSQLRAIQSLADHMAEPGSADSKHAAEVMTNMMQLPQFQEAVQALNNGKISAGRDFADSIPGIDQSSTLYNVLSGVSDAAFMMAVDPILMTGYASSAYKAWKYTVPAMDAAEAATGFRKWVYAKPGVMRTYHALAEAVDKSEQGGLQILRQKAPQLEALYGQMLDYKQLLRDEGRALDVPFLAHDVVEYHIGQNNFKALREGIGTVKEAKGMQLYSQSASNQLFRQFRGEVRSFMNGMADISIERKLAKLAQQGKLIDPALKGTARQAAVQELLHDGIVQIAKRYGRDFEDITGVAMNDVVGIDGLIDKPWRFGHLEANPNAYATGRAFGGGGFGIPAVDRTVAILGRPAAKIGSVLNAMTTMSISGKAISLTGPSATKEIRALSELGRYMGMPSYYNRIWADTILSSTSPAARMDLMHGWLANVMNLTGLGHTKEGEQLITQYLEASKKLYGAGDNVLVNGHPLRVGMFLNETADKFVMPNLHEMRKAAVTGGWGKIMGISDLPIINPLMNKVWKPVILLRLGFIPRAAGEELLSYLLRGGLGSITQEFGGRYLGRREVFRELQSIQNAKMMGQVTRSFTKTEQALLAKGEYALLPTHVRPLARMLQRSDGGDAPMAVLQRYGSWLEARLSPIGRDAALTQAQRAEVIAKGGQLGQTAKVLRSGKIYTRAGEEVAAKAGFGVHNVEARINSILLGNPTSVRRMIAGGVSDDLVEAGRMFVGKHGDVIARDISAVGHGPIDPGFDQTQMHTILKPDKHGELRPVQVFTERGVRQTLDMGDPMAAGALQDSLQRGLAEPAIGADATQNLAFVRGGTTVTQEQLIPHLDRLVLANNGSPVAMQARQVAIQLFGHDFKYEQWRAMLVDMRRDGGPTGKLISETLGNYLKGMRNPTMEDIQAALKNAAKDLDPLQFHGDAALATAKKRLREFGVELDKNVTPTVDWLKTLDISSREFAAQLLHGQTLGGKTSWYGQNFGAARGKPTTEVLDDLLRLDPVTPTDQTTIGYAINHLLAHRQGELNGTDKLMLTQAKEAMRTGTFEPWLSEAGHYGNVRSVAAKVNNPTAPTKWLYDDLHEARLAQVDNIRAKALDPAYHDSGIIKTLRMNVRDEQGQYVDSVMHNSTVLMYEAPRMDSMTWQDVIEHATDRDLISKNRGVIRQLLASDPTETGLVADIRVAEELHRIDASMARIDTSLANVPRMMRADRKAVQGRIVNELRPDDITKTREGTRLWFYPREMASTRLESTPNSLLDPAQQYAEDAVGRLHDLVRRNNVQTVRYKQRLDEQGNQVPLVHKWDGESRTLQGVGPDEEIPMGQINTLMDEHGQPINYADTKYNTGPLKETDQTPSGDVMWEFVGPSMRDTWDQQLGTVRKRLKRQTSSLSLPGRPTQVEDEVPVVWSSLNDVGRVPRDDLPGQVIAEVLRNREVGKWEQFINFGFDEVIGPSIDAVVRRPMAFHYFANRYLQAKRTMGWALDPALAEQVTAIGARYRAAGIGSPLEPEVLARMAKGIASYQGDKMAATWSTEHALSWVHGHTYGELQDVLTATVSSARHASEPGAKAALNYARQLQKLDDPATIERGLTGLERARHSANTDGPMQHVIDMIESDLPPGTLRSMENLNRPNVQDAIGRSPFLQYIDSEKEWPAIMAAHKNLEYHRELAGEVAATAAIGDAMPFIDSHEFKTQFADYASGYIPFWYAEENFMKRWARGLADVGPSLIRRAQLGYMGLKQAGVVRTDQNGHDWFVYPGSGLLVDALSRVPGLRVLQNAGILFQTPTDQMMPGLNNKYGVPSFNPLATLSMSIVEGIFPELQPAKRAMLGDYSSGRSILQQVLPSSVTNLGNALFGDEMTNTRYASAMAAAIAFAEAHGQGPKDDATPGEVDQWFDQIRNHTRMIMVVQMIGGFIVPGAPSELMAGRSANIAGIDAENPADYLASEYQTLVHSLGVEGGTAKFLELNPQGTPHDLQQQVDGVINPLVYSVPKNVSTSGAPIPSTEQALRYIEDNQDYFSAFPNAAPWLIPQNFDDQRSQYAYDQQVSDGLRKRRSPEELFMAMKFKTGSQEYFATQDNYNKAINAAVLADDKVSVDTLRAQLDWKQTTFKLTHPLFRQILEAGDGQERRTKVLAEMRTVVDDPQSPPTPQMAALSHAMHSFDGYTTRLSVLQNNHTAAGRAEVDHLKVQYQTYMENLVRDNPAINSFWVSVLRPESSLS